MPRARPLSVAALSVEPLDARRHNRAALTCSVESLDVYLKTQASRDMRRRAKAVFVLVRADAPGQMVGYFTLCACALAPGDVPEAARRYIPRYPLVLRQRASGQLHLNVRF